MPQLNPAPWFAILVFSWFVLLTIIPPKVLNHTFPNEPGKALTQTSPSEPASLDAPKLKPEPWNWPWH